MAEEKNTVEELVKQFDEKKKEIQKKREQENPDGRLTGYQLKMMTNVIGGEKDQMAGQVKKQGLAHESFPEKENFMTKLIRNYRKAVNELEIIQGILPRYPEELKQELEEYNQKRIDIAKRNAGIPEDEDIQQVSVGQIKGEGNYDIFKGEINNLDEEYSEALEKQEEIDEQIDEILKKPLGNPDFDMIKETEVPASITGDKLDAIWPMIEPVK